MPGLRDRGILIAFEGIDGAGKTTQVSLLGDALTRAGEAPVLSKEPTNGPWGRLIKQSAASGRLSPEEELRAFLNDRAEHVQTLILPALEEGRVVILDRYFYSTMAYQGSRGANVQEIQHIMESRFPVPDAVFIIDVEPSLGLYRIAHSRVETPNHFENRTNLAQARSIFQAMDGPAIHHIDGSLPRESILEKVLEALIQGPLKTKRGAKSGEWWRTAAGIHGTGWAGGSPGC